MKVLVGCERSQKIVKAFRDNEDEAYSCDVLPCEGGHPEWHIQGDILNVLEYGGGFTQDGHPVRSDVEWKPIVEWDLLIVHPPCTYLCNSGVRWLYNEDGTKNGQRWVNMKAGVVFFKKLLYAPVEHIAVENPIMHRYAREEVGVNYGQLIQPWMFGNPNTKATGLWLKNIPPLQPTQIVSKNERIHTVHEMPPSENRGYLRSVTFDEIAEAMASQWGCLK